MTDHDGPHAPWSPPGSSGWTPVVPLGGVSDPSATPPPDAGRAAPLDPSQHEVRRGRGWTGRVIGALAAVVGGLNLVAGSFLDWVRADVLGEGIRYGSGWHNIDGNVGDGPVLAGIGAVVAVWGAVVLVRGSSPRLAAAVVVAGFVAMGVVIYEIVDLSSPPEGITTSLQTGVWMMAAGAMLVVFGGWAVWLSARRAAAGRVTVTP